MIPLFIDRPKRGGAYCEHRFARSTGRASHRLARLFRSGDDLSGRSSRTQHVAFYSASWIDPHASEVWHLYTMTLSDQTEADLAKTRAEKLGYILAGVPENHRQASFLNRGPLFHPDGPSTGAQQTLIQPAASVPWPSNYALGTCNIQELFRQFALSGCMHGTAVRFDSPSFDASFGVSPF